VLSQTLLAQVLFQSLLASLFAQAPAQDTTPATPSSKVLRIPVEQEHLCCYGVHFVEPVYPREARLARVEGQVKLFLVVEQNGTIAELKAISGDQLLMNATLNAVRQWRFGSMIAGVVDGRRKLEYEIPMTFTFTIEEPPNPAYLHLTNGKVIRADTVREFTDRIEYTVGHRTHRIAPGSVTDVNACARVASHLTMKEGDCVPAGGPTFKIRAIPLWPSDKERKATDTPSRN
jgi:TonB family protein